MWFATCKNALDQLTPQQIEVYDLISTQELPLKNMMKNEGDIMEYVVGIYNFYDVDAGASEDMSFYFPTYK
jgi:hypothetical protein